MCGDLWSHKDFVHLCVHNQGAVCNFRALKSFMRRIWTDDNTGWIMGISLTHWVISSPRWILFLRICFADRFGFSGLLFLSLTRDTAYARVRALRIYGSAEHKQCNRAGR